MLVLTRKVGESIIINEGKMDEIVITVTRVNGKAVRIGVEAPDYMPIIRSNTNTEEEDETTSNGR